MASPLSGPTNNRGSLEAWVVTANPKDADRTGLDVISHTFAKVIAIDLAEAGSSLTQITATAHAGRPGDILQFASGIEVSVLRTTADTLILGQELDSIPAPGTSFKILRYVTREAIDPQYAVCLDSVGGGVSYIGEAEPGTLTSAASWRIKRMTEASDDITIVWADGNSFFDNVWDNRVSLSYS